MSDEKCPACAAMGVEIVRTATGWKCGECGTVWAPEKTEPMDDVLGSTAAERALTLRVRMHWVLMFAGWGCVAAGLIWAFGWPAVLALGGIALLFASDGV